jgi:D-sedoheptulose 7-phosphate isomerase
MRAYFEELAALAAGASDAFGADLARAAALVSSAAISGRTTFSFGNGGSATQAQHFAAELVVRYKDDRRALPAIALTADIAILTACTNDYDYSVVFQRQIEALGRAGDVAVGITTSGKSPNVLKALAAARRRGLATILLTGARGREEARVWDVGIVVPSEETAHVQELHLACLHLICREVDRHLQASGAPNLRS